MATHPDYRIEQMFSRLDVLAFRINIRLAGWVSELNMAIALGFRVDRIHLPKRWLARKAITLERSD